MSRSALWKQEGKVKEREHRADAIFLAAVEEGRSRNPKSFLPLWGPDDSFHFNPLLLQNIIQSPYFQKCCESLKDWNAVIDEIYYEVKHLLPFQMGKTPSTAFCLLLRLLTLRMTPHQLDLTLKHADSPYIRCIGFLYLRYAGPQDQLWELIRPYVLDQEQVKVQPGNSSTASITVGEYVRTLFSEREYHGTPLPRLPMERTLRAQLLRASATEERALQHFKNAQRLRYFETLGSRVMAQYGDDENPVEWYEAVVDRVIKTEEGVVLKYPKFVVTFPEYGNTETVSLGEMDVMDGDWRNASRGGGGGGGYSKNDKRGRPQHQQPRNEDDHWYEEVRRRERETTAASKGWARRPPSTKASLTTSTSSSSRQVGGYNNDDDEEDRIARRRQEEQRQRSSRDRSPPKSSEDSHPSAAPPRKRTPEEMAELQAKKRRLMAKYG